MYTKISDIQPTSPVLVIGIENWIDAGFGATNALVALNNALTLEVLGTFDSNQLLDQRSRRPVSRLVDGVNTEIIWPGIELRSGRDSAANEVVVLSGPEPDFRWKDFTSSVVQLAQDMDVRLAVGLGAFPAPVPHTRPTTVISSASDQSLADQVGFLHGAMDVPAGIQAVLERALGDAGIPALTLWARVPHYVAGMPYPSASVSLLQQLNAVSGVMIETGDLLEAAVETSARIDELISNSAEHAQLVAQLAEQLDAEQAASRDFNNLPTGDEIAAELERFLRQQS